MPRLKDLSKIDFSEPESRSLEAIRTSALMRIADATELMAKNSRELERDRDMYKRWYNEERERAARLERRLIANRGVITRQRNIIQKLQNGANQNNEN